TTRSAAPPAATVAADRFPSTGRCGRVPATAASRTPTLAGWPVPRGATPVARRRIPRVSGPRSGDPDRLPQGHGGPPKRSAKAERAAGRQRAEWVARHRRSPSSQKRTRATRLCVSYETHETHEKEPLFFFAVFVV